MLIIVLEKSWKWCYDTFMITQQTQIKLNLPVMLKQQLEQKAGRFGIPLAGYIKHLILKDIETVLHPTFEASQRTVRAYTAAKKQEKDDKLVHVNDVDAYLDTL